MKPKLKFDQAQLKSFLILHVEKIVFGAFVLALLLISWSALKWKPYDKTPQDLMAVADRVSKKVEESKPPEKFEKLAQVPNFAGLGAAGPALVDATYFRIEPLERPYQEQNIRRAMPSFLPVKELLVSSGYGPIAIGQTGSVPRMGGAMAGEMGGMMDEQMPGMPGGDPSAMMKGMAGMSGMMNRRPPGIGGGGPPAGMAEGMQNMMRGRGGMGGMAGMPGGQGRGRGRSKGGQNIRNRKEEAQREREEQKKLAEENRKAEEAAALAARKSAAGEHVLASAPSGTQLEGRYWVCLVGAIPANAQFQEYHRTFRDSTYPDKSRNYPEYVSPDIERAEVIPGEEPKWQSVNFLAAWEDMLKWGAEYPDVVPSEYLEVITEPLPPLIGADLDPDEVSHPRVPLLAEKLAEEERQNALKQKETKPNRKGRRIAPHSAGGPGGAARMPGGMGPMGAGRMRGYGQGMRRGMMGGGMGMMGGGMMGGGPMSGMGPMGGGMGPMGGGMGPMGGGMGPMGGGMGQMGGGYGGMPAGSNARQASRQPEWKLFRFFDFDVEPGKTYQYRVKLVFANPNYEIPKRYLEDYADREGEYREAPWSEPSPAVMVRYGSRMLAGPLVKERAGEPIVELALKQFDQEEAADARDFIDVARGAVLNKRGAKVLVPDSESAPGSSGDSREIEVDFQTDTLLVDILGGEPISGGRGKKAPGHVLVLRNDGEFAILDEAADSQEFQMEKAQQDEMKPAEEDEQTGGADFGSVFKFNAPGDEKPAKKGSKK